MSGNHAQASDRTKHRPGSTQKPETSAKSRQPNALHAASPTKRWFDPWNTTSTGHQHVKHVLSGSTIWRDHRHVKLATQFGDQKSNNYGARTEFGKEAASSTDHQHDGRLVDGTRSRGTRVVGRENQTRITESFMAPKASSPSLKRKREETEEVMPSYQPRAKTKELRNEVENAAQIHLSPPSPPSAQPDRTPPPSPSSRLRTPIFRGLVFYVNGSTYPVVSDHRLKQIIAHNGGGLVTQLLRRKITHIILGCDTRTTPKGDSTHGLAGGKIQKELQRIRGESIKFVDVAWVLECVRVGKRVPEGPWIRHLAGSRQKDAKECFARRKAGFEGP